MRHSAGLNPARSSILLRAFRRFAGLTAALARSPPKLQRRWTGGLLHPQERQKIILDQCPERQRERPLKPRAISLREFESHLVCQYCACGETAYARRRERRGETHAGSNPAKHTKTPSFNGRTAHCRCANRGSIPLGVAIHPACTLAWSRLSPSEGENGGSNPPTLTNFTWPQERSSPCKPTLPSCSMRISGR